MPILQWATFVVANGAGNLMNVGPYALLVALGGWRPIAALATERVAAAVVNDLSSRHLVFRARSNR